jgi:leucyl aminopeptidase
MSGIAPIELKKATKASGLTIHLVSSKNDVSKVDSLGELKKKVADRLSDEELIFHLPSSSNGTVVVKAKKDEELSYRLQNWRVAAAKLKSLFSTEKVESVSVVNEGIETDELLAFVEGLVLSNYQFLTYKTGEKAKPSVLRKLSLIDKTITQQQVDELQALLAATFAARDFVNEPVITLSASEWSKRIKALGKKSGFSVTVFDKKKIESLGMGGLLGVNKGSVEPPTFNILEWKPKNAKNKKPIVLVGKGVVYDTGGYNVKTVQMANMKCDMGGGAAVCGALTAVALNELPVHVIGLIPSTDNRIDGKALVADDVITMMSGTNVEVLNTDAEGRLILADALHYAKQYKPELVIDLATLTGAAARITDYHGIAMCADKAPQKEQLKASGEAVYERLMEFPMWKEFHDVIKSEVADIKNIGGAAGGNITAATFLHHFTDYPWIHLDIAGPAFMDSSVDYRLKGGTGVGVRLLYHFIKTNFA